ncbi:hypothetical protein HUJ04_012199, partial [Dendroctonus ponderosae]
MKHYLHKFKLTNNATCTCGIGDETTDHIKYHCTETDRQRAREHIRDKYSNFTINLRDQDGNKTEDINKLNEWAQLALRTEDMSLDGSSNIKNTSARANSAMIALSRLMPNIGGPSPNKRRLLCSVARSILLYAAPAWGHSMNTAKHRNIHTRIQRQAALRICSAYPCLNSRPISPMSSDPSDPQPLTPAHFLIGERLTNLPDKDYCQIPENRLSRFQRLQQITQGFWARWSKEYVAELQQRTKWKKNALNLLSPGSLVLIKEDGLPPLKWMMGVVQEVHPGADGVIRTATIKTASSTLKRPVTKLLQANIALWIKRKHGDTDHYLTQLLTGHELFRENTYNIGKTSDD